jgi:hypothetical protein
MLRSLTKDSGGALTEFLRMTGSSVWRSQAHQRSVQHRCRTSCEVRSRAITSLALPPVSEGFFAQGSSFGSLGLADDVVKSVHAAGFRNPSYTQVRDITYCTSTYLLCFLTFTLPPRCTSPKSASGLGRHTMYRKGHERLLYVSTQLKNNTHVNTLVCSLNVLKGFGGRWMGNCVARGS